MGITGLIPFLEKASKRGNISQFSGGTVAIDSYCWLHKGAFSCADKLSLGQPTDAYVTYCMKFVSMLLANRIKPILVFDGRHLPAKADTETKRRESRNANRKRAAELMRMGQTAEGKNLLRRSVDITHEMALELIKRCHDRNVDCIVAPYEADAQLAYLNISGIADVVITEDSDLTLFGCKKIFFKMDVNGNGLLVEQDRLHLAMGVRPENFDIDKFRYMCILSGCDYLASLPGIGLSKACKFITKTQDPDISRAITRMPSYLNMKSLEVSKDYRDGFMRAVVTFKHQLVFCPLRRCQLRLNPPTPEVTLEQLHYAGDEMSRDVAWQMALGNYDPFTLKQLHDYDPDNFKPGTNSRRTNSWNEQQVAKHASIWANDFEIKDKAPKKDKITTLWPNTVGKVITLKTTIIKKDSTPPKRSYDEVEDLADSDILKAYGNGESDPKRVCNGISESSSNLDLSSPEEEHKSPVLMRRANLFAKKTSPVETSPSLLDKSKRRAKFGNVARFKPTVVNNNIITMSKFFASSSETGKVLSNLTSEINSMEYQQAGKGYEGFEMKQSDEDEDVNSKEPRNDILSIEDSTNPVLDEQSEAITNSEKENENKTYGNNEVEIAPMQMIDDASCAMENETDREKALEEISNNFLSEKESVPSQDFKDYALSNHTEGTSRSSTPDSVLEYSVNIEAVSTPRSNLFKWANPKANGTMRGLADVSMASQRCYTNSQQSTKTTTVKDKTLRKTQVGKRKAPVEQGTQCLLSMFGFQRKTVLKH